MSTIQKIHPFLWFDTQAEEAAKFYVSIFEGSRIVTVSTYPDFGKETHGKPAGSVMTVEFELEGVRFTALNGGPHFKFNEAISLAVLCETQEEIDRLWSQLSADPKAEACGWLKDKFGLSWQITPAIMPALLTDKDEAKRTRAFAAMMDMKKLDIAALKKAAAG